MRGMRKMFLACGRSPWNVVAWKSGVVMGEKQLSGALCRLIFELACVSGVDEASAFAACG
jgi:hypothetical protein